ncbi:hypothetical protein DYB34_010873, partial [Aphanomyces astaci]
MEEPLHTDEVVHAMASLVRASFGPSGAETLLFCPPEPPILTSSGYTILHYADMTKSHIAHPMKSFLMQKVRAVYRDMGDGVSQYLLLLDLILQRIEISRVWSTAFATAKSSIGPLFHATFDTSTIRTAVIFDALHEAARAIVTTALTGLFNPSVVAYLADLTVDWMFKSVAASFHHLLPTTPADLHVYLDHIQRHANDTLLQLSMGPLDASRITRRHEYLIRLSSHSNVTLRDEKLPMGQRIVLFVGSLDQLGASAVEVQVPSATTYLSSIHWSAQRVDEFVTTLKSQHQVNLVLHLTKQVVASCVQHGIVCLPFVDKADLFALAARTGVSWLTNVFDPIDEARHVAVNTAPLRLIRAGGASFVVLDALTCPSTSSYSPTEEATEVRVVVPQVLLRAPSKGLCKQYYYAVKKGLRVLRFWCSSSSMTSPSSFCHDDEATPQTYLASLGGAQAPELGLAHALMHSSPLSSLIPLSVRAILAQALVGTYSLLRANSTASSTSAPFPAVHHHHILMGRIDLDTCDDTPNNPRTSHHKAIKGVVLDMRAVLTTHAGPVEVTRVVEARPEEYGVVHPLGHCCRLLEHVLGTLEEVCRLDKQFLRVRRRTAKER